MRYLEIINEAATAPLYHGTTFSAAMEIVTDGAFRAYTSIGMNGKPYYGVSTTRSPRMSHIDHDPMQKAWEKDTIEGFNVLFVLDQNKVRQRYKIIPYDFFKGNKKMTGFYGEVNKLRDARSESEEFIVIGKDSRTKMPVTGIVTKIIYFANSFKNPEDQPETDVYFIFKKWALTHSIPVVINYTLFGYNDNDRPWNKDLRQSTITHADKNEVRLDPKDHEIETLRNLAQKYTQIDGPNLTTEQLDQAFDKGELFSIWNFWLRMNGRFPAHPVNPVSNKVIAYVFKMITNAKTNTVYRKISPFANKQLTPDEKKLAGMKKRNTNAIR